MSKADLSLLQTLGTYSQLMALLPAVVWLFFRTLYLVNILVSEINAVLDFITGCHEDKSQPKYLKEKLSQI